MVVVAYGASSRTRQRRLWKVVRRECSPCAERALTAILNDRPAVSLGILMSPAERLSALA